MAWCFALLWAVLQICGCHSIDKNESKSCASTDFPDPAPWNSEADTVWDSYLLLPQSQEDQLSSSFCATQIHVFSSQLEDISMIKTEELMRGNQEDGSDGIDGSVFVVLNGENSGIRISYHPKCLGTLNRLAANRLAPKASKKRKLYLYTIAGRPIKGPFDVSRGLHMCQLLLEGESWVWGGVKPGFEFNIGIVPTLPQPDSSPPPSNSIKSASSSLFGLFTKSSSQVSVLENRTSVKMRTISLTPKALQVVNLLEPHFIDQVIESGKTKMMRSPERHYAAGFENYRTSKSAFLTGQHPSHKILVKICQIVARLQYENYPEWPQLLRYDKGDWYKTHRDTFHNYKHPNQYKLDQVRRERNKKHQINLNEWMPWFQNKLDLYKHEQVDKNQIESGFDDVFERGVKAILSSEYNVFEDRSEFELLLVEVLLATTDAEFMGYHADWLKENLARKSSFLLSALLDARLDISTKFVIEKFEEYFQLPDELKFKLKTRNGEAVIKGQQDEFEVLDEDILGPPYVEPNRHCTLMFYLNSLKYGGGETTFPLASENIVATPDGRLLPSNGNKQALSSSSSSSIHPEESSVYHEGMPECSKGLRVKPFQGGGALFYHKLGNGVNDELSSHGGCPPSEADDPSWKINGFMWNMDSAMGPSLFS